MRLSPMILAAAIAAALPGCGGGDSMTAAEKQAFETELADLQRQASLNDSLKKRGYPTIYNSDAVDDKMQGMPAIFSVDAVDDKKQAMPGMINLVNGVSNGLSIEDKKQALPRIMNDGVADIQSTGKMHAMPRIYSEGTDQ